MHVYRQGKQPTGCASEDDNDVEMDEADDDG